MRPEHYRLSVLRQTLQTADEQQRPFIQAATARELYNLSDINEAEGLAQKAQPLGSPFAKSLLQIIAWERRVTEDMKVAENECVRIRYHPRHQRAAQILLEAPCSRLWALRSALDCCPHHFKPTVLLLMEPDLPPAVRGLSAGTIYSRIFITIPPFKSELEEAAFAPKLVDNLTVEYVGALIGWMISWQRPVWLSDGLRHALTRAHVAFPWWVALYRRAAVGTLPLLNTLDSLSAESGKPASRSDRAGQFTEIQLAGLSGYLATEHLLTRMGDKPIGHFLHRVGQVGMEAAFRETFGMTLQEFEESWLKRLRTAIKERLEPGKSLPPDADYIPKVSAEGRKRLDEATAGFVVICTSHFTVRADKRLPKEVRERIALAAEAAREVASRYLPIEGVGRLFILVFRSRSDIEKLIGGKISSELDLPSISFQAGFLLGIDEPKKEEYLASVDYRILQEYLEHVLKHRGKVPAWAVMGRGSCRLACSTVCQFGSCESSSGYQNRSTRCVSSVERKKRGKTPTTRRKRNHRQLETTYQMWRAQVRSVANKAHPQMTKTTNPSIHRLFCCMVLPPFTGGTHYTLSVSNRQAFDMRFLQCQNVGLHWAST